MDNSEETEHYINGQTDWATSSDDIKHTFSNTGYVVPWLFPNSPTPFELVICCTDGILNVVRLGEPVDAHNFVLYGLEILAQINTATKPELDWIPCFFDPADGCYKVEDQTGQLVNEL